MAICASVHATFNAAPICQCSLLGIVTRLTGIDTAPNGVEPRAVSLARRRDLAATLVRSLCCSAVRSASDSRGNI